MGSNLRRVLRAASSEGFFSDVFSAMGNKKELTTKTDTHDEDRHTQEIKKLVAEKLLNKEWLESKRFKTGNIDTASFGQYLAIDGKIGNDPLTLVKHNFDEFSHWMGSLRKEMAKVFGQMDFGFACRDIEENERGGKVKEVLRKIREVLHKHPNPILTCRPPKLAGGFDPISYLGNAKDGYRAINAWGIKDSTQNKITQTSVQAASKEKALEVGKFVESLLGKFDALFNDLPSPKNALDEHQVHHFWSDFLISHEDFETINLTTREAIQDAAAPYIELRTCYRNRIIRGLLLWVQDSIE